MQNILQKVSLREFRFLLIGVGAIITSATVAYFVVPHAKSYWASSREVAVLLQAAQDGNELDDHLREQVERIKDLDYRLHGDMANMPVRQIESYIIGHLQRISWGNDVELVSVQPATGERIEIFQELIFNVQLSGQYADLYEWIWEARNDLGFVVVKEYGLARRNDDNDEPLLLANLSLASYRAVE